MESHAEEVTDDGGTSLVLVVKCGVFGSITMGLNVVQCSSPFSSKVWPITLFFAAFFPLEGCYKNFFPLSEGSHSA